jgi:hypothetical protein
MNKKRKIKKKKKVVKEKKEDPRMEHTEKISKMINVHIIMTKITLNINGINTQ